MGVSVDKARFLIFCSPDVGIHVVKLSAEMQNQILELLQQGEHHLEPVSHIPYLDDEQVAVISSHIAKRASIDLPSRHTQIDAATSATSASSTSESFPNSPSRQETMQSSSPSRRDLVFKALDKVQSQATGCSLGCAHPVRIPSATGKPAGVGLQKLRSG